MMAHPSWLSGMFSLSCLRRPISSRTLLCAGLCLMLVVTVMAGLLAGGVGALGLPYCRTLGARSEPVTDDSGAAPVYSALYTCVLLLLWGGPGPFVLRCC